jgi:hypothetical protein
MASIEELAYTLIHGIDIMTHALHAASIVIAMVLWVMAVGLWRAHRSNPKYVPLGKPLIYLFLGFILFGIPFCNLLFQSTGSPMDLQQQASVHMLGIDAPLEGFIELAEEE